MVQNTFHNQNMNNMSDTTHNNIITKIDYFYPSAYVISEKQLTNNIPKTYCILYSLRYDFVTHTYVDNQKSQNYKLFFIF